jgi:uncharacterized repeat protein (TIGR03803 family)
VSRFHPLARGRERFSESPPTARISRCCIALAAAMTGECRRAFSCQEQPFTGPTGLGGGSTCGTIYSVNNDGTGFKTLYSFTGGSDGAFPRAGLIFSGGILYGTTGAGGSSTNGTVFRISLSPAPPLRLVASGPNLVFSRPATASGLTLRSTASLGAAADWTTLNPETTPAVVDGQFTMTISDAFTGSQRFFRLSQ